MIDLNQYPSVVQTAPHWEVSSQYRFIPTMEVLEVLDQKGWEIRSVTEQKARENYGYQKHLIRLRHKEFAFAGVDDLIPEMILENSHDRSSCFILRFGIFRLVCTNGMVAESANFGSMRIRHIGYDKEDVIDASYKIIEESPVIAHTVNIFRQVSLEEKEKLTFSEAGKALRWPENPQRGIAGDMIQPRRLEDRGSDLLTVYNVIQENLIKGGQEYVASDGSHRIVNPIRNINNDMRINLGLWRLAEDIYRWKDGGKLRSKWPEEDEEKPVYDPRKILHLGLLYSLH